MKQASFQIGNSVNKEKNNLIKDVNVEKEFNKNTITSHKIINDTKRDNNPRKLVENIYYF